MNGGEKIFLEPAITSSQVPKLIGNLGLKKRGEAVGVVPDDILKLFKQIRLGKFGGWRSVEGGKFEVLLAG